MMQKEYQTMNTPDSLWRVNKRKENTIIALKIICEVMLLLIGVVLIFTYQWRLLPIFFLGTLGMIILAKGILRSIMKAKYEEDLTEAYKEEYDYAKTKVMVSDLRFRNVEEQEVLRRIICDQEIKTVYLLAAVTALAGLLMYFFMNPNPEIESLIKKISAGWRVLL